MGRVSTALFPTAQSIGRRIVDTAQHVGIVGIGDEYLSRTGRASSSQFGVHYPQRADFVIFYSGSAGDVGQRVQRCLCCAMLGKKPVEGRDADTARTQ